MTASYYNNLDVFFPGDPYTPSISNILLFPIVIGHNVSVGYARLAANISVASTQATGTSADTSFSFDQYRSNAVVLYSQGVGASSMSLMSFFSSYGAWTVRRIFTNGTEGSQYTVSQYITYPAQDGNGASTVSGTTAHSSASYVAATGHFTQFTGSRFIDIPFSTSLQAGNYWVAYGVSNSYASNAGPAALSGAILSNQFRNMSQSNLTFAPLGVAVNASHCFQPLNGEVSTNSAIMSLSAFDANKVTVRVSNPTPYFQLINRA